MAGAARECGRGRWGTSCVLGLWPSSVHSKHLLPSGTMWKRKDAEELWEDLQAQGRACSRLPRSQSLRHAWVATEAAEVSEDACDTPPSLPGLETSPALATFLYRSVVTDTVAT